MLSERVELEVKAPTYDLLTELRDARKLGKYLVDQNQGFKESYQRLLSLVEAQGALITHALKMQGQHAPGKSEQNRLVRRWRDALDKARERIDV